MVLIIAEIGVNWGTLLSAKQMINCAKWSGADAVKFQVYNKENIQGSEHYDQLCQIMLGPERLKELKQHADNMGIEFFATPMFVEAVDWLEDDIGVKRYKVRFSDRYNKSLLTKVIETGKPVYISTTHTSDFAYDTFYHHIKPIYCVPKYPPELVDIQLGRYYNGYSNHYPNIGVPIAMFSQAVSKHDFYLEVHVKLDGPPPIDNAVSVSFGDFKRMCEYLREIEKIGV